MQPKAPSEIYDEIQTSAPAERQQQGFNLIIGMLGHGNGCERRLLGIAMGQLQQALVACNAGRILRALTTGVSGLHVPDAQRQAQAFAQTLAMLLECECSRLQAVVDMQGMYLARPPACAQHQQGARVGAAAQCHSQRQRGMKVHHRLFQRLGHGTSEGKLLRVGFGVGKTAVALQAFIAAVDQFAGLEVCQLAVAVG